MKKLPTLLLLVSAAAACANPLGTEPVTAPDAALGAAAQAKPETSLSIAWTGGSVTCMYGLSFTVTGQNLSPRSRFLKVWLNKTEGGSWVYTGSIGAQARKNLNVTFYVPPEEVNPIGGPKFTGYAEVVVTDAFTGWVHDTGPVFIGPAC